MNKPTPTPVAVETSAVPIAHELKLSKDGEEWLKNISSGLFGDYEQVQKIWNAPQTQFALTLVQDQEFRSSVHEMQESHLCSRLVGYEVVLILLLWIFRAWRLTKVSTWLTRIWTQAWIGAVYWALAVFLVPGLVWGEAYRTALSHLVRAILRHFFA